MKICVTPKNPKMCDPILVTVLKMRPYRAAQPHKPKKVPLPPPAPLGVYTVEHYKNISTLRSYEPLFNV